MRLGPADAVIDVGERRRIAVGRVPEIQRDHHIAALRQVFAEAGAVVEVAIVPGAAMQIDIGRERARSFGLEHPRHNLALAMLQITNVFLGELRHRRWSSLGTAAARMAAAFAQLRPLAYPARPARTNA